MIDILKDYWFILSPDIYIGYENNPDKMLLYNTKTGLAIDTNDKNCIQLIKKVHLPESLGVIKLHSIYRKNDVCVSFISQLIRNGFCEIKEIQEIGEKPVNLLPILHIRKDIKTKADKKQSEMGANLLSYLREVNIHINGDCLLNCKHCEEYNKQALSCLKTKDIISPIHIENIFKQIKYSNVKNINILGGNIYLYPYWNKLSEIIEKYNFDFHYWINEKNIIFDTNQYFEVTDIIFTSPIKKERISEVINYYNKSCFHFFIENLQDYNIVENTLSSLKNIRYNIKPVYTGKNDTFFDEYIFLDKEDILGEVKSMHEIFRNQKLNFNFFGILHIFSDGSIKASYNTARLSSIYKGSLLEAIYQEISQNSCWRKIRNYGTCANCYYNYICSPPTNYEMIIGKPNLCHVK